MNTVKVEQLSNLAMTTGGEKKYPFVCDGMWVKMWTGIGWINSHYATRKDREKYPTVVR